MPIEISDTLDFSHSLKFLRKISNPLKFAPNVHPEEKMTDCLTFYCVLVRVWWLFFWKFSFAFLIENILELGSMNMFVAKKRRLPEKNLTLWRFSRCFHTTSLWLLLTNHGIVNNVFRMVNFPYFLISALFLRRYSASWTLIFAFSPIFSKFSFLQLKKPHPQRLQLQVNYKMSYRSSL